MSVQHNDDLFASEEMKMRWQTVYEFLGSDGAGVAIDKDFMLRVLHHLSQALTINSTNESLWKAFVLVDVLVDRWDECVAIFKEEEVSVDNIG